MRLRVPDPRLARPGGRLTPGLKLGLALGLVVLVVLLPRAVSWIYAVPAAVLLFLAAWCRLPPGHFFRRLLLAECFILGMAVLSLLSPATRPVFFAVWLKSTLCVTAMLLLTWTTPFSEILTVLRQWHFPAPMVATLTLMSRYLPVLAEESSRMQRARASRTFSRQRRVLWSNLAAIAGQLFIRSAGRAERIYLAMCARGWK